MLPRISNSVLSFLLLVFIQVNSSYIDQIEYQKEKDLSGPLTVPLPESNKVPPSITEQPEEFTYIQKEQKLELPCMASGNPQPKYTWYKMESKWISTVHSTRGKLFSD